MSIIQGSANRASVRGFYPKTLEGSLRFNDDDSAYLSYTPSTTGNRKTWTFSAWVKRANLGGTQNILIAGTNTTGAYSVQITFNSNDGLTVYTDHVGYSVYQLITNAKYRDPSAWYHIVVRFDTTQATASDRMRLYVNGEQVTSFSTASYQPQNSDWPINQSGQAHTIGRFSTVATNYLDGYLAEVHFTDGTAYTASDFGELKNGVWVAKEPSVTYGTNGFYLDFLDDTEVEAFNTLLWRGNGIQGHGITGTGFSPDLVWIKERNGARQHHLYDTVRGSNRVLFSSLTNAESYNSTFLTSYDSDGFSVGSDIGINGSGQSFVAWCWDAGANNAVTGHSSVTYTGNGGTQTISGLPFSPDLLWIAERNGSNGNQIVDTIRGAGANLKSHTTDAEGSLTTGVQSFLPNGFSIGTNTAYNEVNLNYVAWAWDAGDSDPVSNTNGSITSTVKASTTNGFSIVSYTGSGSNATVGHGLSSAPDMIIFKNRDDGAHHWTTYHQAIGATKFLYLNSTIAATTHNQFQDTDPTSSVFYVSADDIGTGNVNSTNEAHIAYCFHDVTGKQKFGSYSGGTANYKVTTGFRPGFVMIKRTDSTSDWQIFDGTRSPFNPVVNRLNPNQSYAELTNGDLDFLDDGFELNSISNGWNGTGGTYIYAAFAGSYSDYITDYNTDGSIDSRVKANQTTGFSIASYQGTGSQATFGHGLGANPSMFIIKNRNAITPWLVWHKDLSTPATQWLKLETTDSVFTNGDAFGTAPTSSVITVNTFSSTNGSGNNLICYAWAEKTGYSKFGSYTGNGSSSGPSVTTNFNPACLIVKRTDTTGNWFIWDNTRDTDGVFNTNIHPNLSNAEAASGSNFVTPSSTGFQLTGTGAETNASGGTYIYAAFADTREAAFWLDQSGNDNDWQPVNLDHNDTVSDSPTDNFCTWNPLNKGTNLVTSDGNLSFNNSTTETTHRTCVATHGMTSGKYYWEVEVDSTTNVDMIGIVGQNATLNSGHVGTSGFGYGYSIANGNWYKASGWADDGTTPPAFPAGGIIGIAFDADNKKIYFHRDGTWVNNANPTAGTGANGTYTGSETVFFPAGSRYYNTGKWVANFGQQPFKYDPPA